MIQKAILISSFICYSIISFGQQAVGTIAGTVKDAKGTAIPFSSIAILGTNQGTISDEQGHFSLNTPVIGSQTLVVSSLGYEPRHIPLSLGKEKQLKLDVLLESGSIAINEVVVSEKSETTRRKELPFSITAIDAKPLQAKNMDINQVLNTTTGIRIREEGGLGSNFSFSLNGFTGNQVKFFLDGVPMDNFGSSLTLNNIPVNLISSIEVYKGVVPIHLGSDALGGAVNVITNNKISNYVDASYAYGSFNTHRLALISRYTHAKTGLVVKANAFYNYSDNDYKMFIPVSDISNGGKYGEPEWIRRFHDAYESQTVQLEIGVMDKKLADRLFFGIITSKNYKELQTGHNMNIVIGEAFDEDQVIIPTLHYSKNDLFIPGLSVNLYANYNFRQALSADTSSRKYDWYQNYEVKGINTTSGEIAWNKTLFSYNDNSALVSANLTYTINSNHSLSLNNTYSSFRRKGEDPISLSVVPFSKPNVLNKNITGFSYSISLLGGKLKTVVFTKLFVMESTGFEGDRYSKSDTALTKIKAAYNKSSLGIASTYYLTPETQLKLSYENTYRLPEAREMFGNGLTLLSNLNIQPEESKNFNVGILSNHTFNRHRLMAELEYLYRLPENMIRYMAEGNDGFYENLVSVKGYSIEGGIKYNYNNKLNLELNGTYQKMVYNNKTTPTGGVNYLYEQQLANIPFLFGSLNMGYQWANVLGDGNTLAANWATLFVESFYLKSPSNGNPTGKNDIPRQISNSANVSYSFKNGQYTISLACTNLSDKPLYDNWKLPKPGRAFNVKLRYYIFSNQ
ncbi:MAG: TonB-dependent receptor plug domain-containing protein [Salinivirgaceae bacterium]